MDPFHKVLFSLISLVTLSGGGIKKNQQMSFNPDPASKIKASNILFALGKPDTIKRLEIIALGVGG